MKYVLGVKEDMYLVKKMNKIVNEEISTYSKSILAVTRGRRREKDKIRK
jgi:hypothetical protein